MEEAKERALDQLGVVADEAEFEVLAEPKQGLFGRVRGEARVRARVRPAPVRPKQDRRRGRRGAESNGEAATTPPPQLSRPPTTTRRRRLIVVPVAAGVAVMPRPALPRPTAPILPEDP